MNERILVDWLCRDESDYFGLLLQQQAEQEYVWLLGLRGAGQRLWVRVIRPVARLLIRLAMLHLRSEPRWRRERWKAKT